MFNFDILLFHAKFPKYINREYVYYFSLLLHVDIDYNFRKLRLLRELNLINN
jgi:hypothetical protein